jgi:hypothetical protein
MFFYQNRGGRGATFSRPPSLSDQRGKTMHHLQHMMHFRTLMAEAGMLFAGLPIWTLFRGLNRIHKTRRRDDRDFYYENGVAIPFEDLESRL